MLSGILALTSVEFFAKGTGADTTNSLTALMISTKNIRTTSNSFMISSDWFDGCICNNCAGGEQSRFDVNARQFRLLLRVSSIRQCSQQLSLNGAYVVS